MATAREVIQFSLRYIGKETSLKKATTADYSVMLNVLNQLLDRWFKLGLRAATNTTTIPGPESAVPYPDYALPAIQYNLAVDGWPLFNLGSPVASNVQVMADSTKNELWTIAAQNPHSVFPGSLPVGSGNEWDGVWSERFYPNCDPQIYGCCDDDQLLSQSGIPLKGVDNE